MPAGRPFDGARGTAGVKYRFSFFLLPDYWQAMNHTRITLPALCSE
jgi:hypothetical protein